MLNKILSSQSSGEETPRPSSVEVVRSRTLFGRGRTAIGLVTLIGLILLLFVSFVDLAAVAQQLKAADVPALVMASLLLVAGLLAYAYRWRLLLAKKPSLSQTFHASNVGHAVNILIPARAGEAARIAVMASSGAVSVTQATSSFVVERLFEQIMRLSALIGAIALGAGIQLSPFSIIGGLGFVLIALGAIAWLVRHQETALTAGPIWLARLPRITEAKARKMLADLLDTLAENSSAGQLALLFLWSIIPWSLFWGFNFLTLLALGDNFASGERVALSLAALALSPPSAPTQPGIFHASVVVPLAAVGYSAEALTAYAVVLHIFEMVWMFGLGLFGLTRTGLSAQTLFTKSSR